MNALPQAVALLMVAVLTAAVVHKLGAIVRRRADEEPIIRLSRWRRRRASTLLGAVGVFESVLAALFLVAPEPAHALAALVLVAYGFELRRLPSDERCGCLGELFPTSSRGAMVRNVALASLNLAALGILLSGDRAALLSEQSLGIALLGLAVLGGSAVVHRLHAEIG